MGTFMLHAGPAEWPPASEECVVRFASDAADPPKRCGPTVPYDVWHIRRKHLTTFQIPVQVRTGTRPGPAPIDGFRELLNKVDASIRQLRQCASSNGTSNVNDEQKTLSEFEQTVRQTMQLVNR